MEEIKKIIQQYQNNEHKTLLIDKKTYLITE